MERSIGLVVVALVAAAASGAVVWADGGDTNQIHACLLNSPDSFSNVRIVGADEACPAGTPLHWSVAGPEGPQGPPGPEGETGGLPTSEVEIPSKKSASPPGKVSKQIYKPLGINPAKSKLVTGTVGPEPQDFQRSLSVSCPASHPFAMYGWWEAVPAFEGQEFTAFASHPVGWHAWYAYVSASWTKNSVTFGPELTPWALKVKVSCAVANITKATAGGSKPNK